MKKFVSFVAVLLSFTLSSGVTMAGQGNNLPSGPRYMLNVIAFDNCPAGDFINSDRHMIAVKANFDPYSDPSQPLTGTQAGKLASELIKTNTIGLTQGSDFQVLDGNACNKGGAEFMLPADPYTCPVDDLSCLNTDPTFQAYNVFVRLVGATEDGDWRHDLCNRNGHGSDDMGNSRHDRLFHRKCSQGSDDWKRQYAV